METLLLSSTREIHCINVDSIVRIEASSNYSKLFFSDGKTLVVAKILRWFEEQLPKDFFFRVHRTHLINKRYLVSIQKNHAVLHSGDQVSISRRKRKLWIMNF